MYHLNGRYGCPPALHHHDVWSLDCYKRPCPEDTHGSSIASDLASSKHGPFYEMQRVSKNNSRKATVRASYEAAVMDVCVFTYQLQCAGAQSQLETFCSAFRTAPSLNHSWAAPLVAPPRSSPVMEPTAYKFASRAPVVRRSPNAKASTTKQSRPNSHQLSPPSAVRKPPSSSSSPAYHPSARPCFEPLVPLQYDESLASFQHRIDGMTGQRGGWGF